MAEEETLLLARVSVTKVTRICGREQGSGSRSLVSLRQFVTDVTRPHKCFLLGAYGCAWIYQRLAELWRTEEGAFLPAATVPRSR
jgi:hypothetical protein